MPDLPTDQPAAVPAARAVEVSRAEKWFEVAATLLLALTALATAWSGYQASLWDGIQSSKYTQASGARTAASQLRTEANQFRIADLTAFENYIDAVLGDDEVVATFYRDRFRDEFRVAYDAWMELDPLSNPTAPATPLAMPEYQIAAEREADELERRADTLFAEGEDANTDSDVYTLATLLFAVVLFFTAVSERFDYRPVRVTLLSFAGVGLVGGVLVAITQPVTGG